MKKHPTKHDAQKHLVFFKHDGLFYAIPKAIANRYIVEAEQAVCRKGNISAEEIFSELDKKHSKAGALLKGLRAREGLSQVEFAKKIGVTQGNLSKMENGTRPIGLTVAKRIAKKFDVNIDHFTGDNLV